jgi:hypothetical protein
MEVNSSDKITQAAYEPLGKLAPINTRATLILGYQKSCSQLKEGFKRSKSGLGMKKG